MIITTKRNKKMKRIVSLLLLLSLSANAQALRSLKDVMKEMGDSFKNINTTVAATGIDDKVATESANILKLIKESQTFSPTTVTNLPNVDREKAQAKYIAELNDLTVTAQKLDDAIKAKNVDLTKQILLTLTDMKKQGHKDFK
jgi:dGTP triphosphohydrolase